MFPSLCLISSTLWPVTMRCLRPALSDLARKHVREEEDAEVRGAPGSWEALFEAIEQCEHGEGDEGVKPRAVQCVDDEARECIGDRVLWRRGAARGFLLVKVVIVLRHRDVSGMISGSCRCD